MAHDRFVAPLPRGWPRRVRSAVIHTISLARTSVTHTRSWTANHYNARIRLNAENDRLRGEILHLREEGWIKDARMDQIPPTGVHTTLPSSDSGSSSCGPREVGRWHSAQSTFSFPPSRSARGHSGSMRKAPTLSSRCRCRSTRSQGSLATACAA